MYSSKNYRHFYFKPKTTVQVKIQEVILLFLYIIIILMEDSSYVINLSLLNFFLWACFSFCFSTSFFFKFFYFILFLKIYLFIYLFIFGCVGSSFLCKGFLQLRQAGASHYCRLSCCGAQAPDAQAQQLWLTGLVALRHVGSSRTKARTRVPCIGRQTLNHCTTREAPVYHFIIISVAE